VLSLHAGCHLSDFGGGDEGGLKAGHAPPRDEEEIAASEEFLCPRAGDSGGDFGVVGGGDGTDEPDGEIRFGQGTDGGGKGLLGAGDEVDAGGASALGEAGQEAMHGVPPLFEEVGDFVNEDDDAGFGDAVAVAAHHFFDQFAEEEEGVMSIALEGAEEMGEGGERAEAGSFGVNEDELDFAEAVVHGKGEGHCAGEGGFAGAGGAGDENVGDIGGGETQEERNAAFVKAEEGSLFGNGGELAAEGEEEGLS